MPDEQQSKAAGNIDVADFGDKDLGGDAKAAAAGAAADEIASMIPMGQPILVGHHSEGRHRRDLARIDRGMRESIDSSRKAESMRSRADNIDAAVDAAIYDDDPDAVERLREKIAALEAKRERMKQANAEYRKAHRDELRAMSSYERSQGVPFPAYALSNLGGVLSTTRKRLKRLEANGGKPPNKILTARRDDVCGECGAAIARGDTIRWNRADGARCRRCEGANDASTDVDGADGRESGAGGGDALPPDDRPAETFDGDDGQQRTITSTGAPYTTPERRGQVLAEIDRLTWQTMPEGGTLSVGFMPGEGIKATIRELRLPKVSGIAIGGLEFHDDVEGEYPGLYGIEANYANGRARVYVIDNGCEILPAVCDFWPAAA